MCLLADEHILDTAWADAFAQTGVALDRALGSGPQEAQELRERIEALRSAPSALEAARSKREEHAADRAKFQQLLESLQARPPPQSSAITATRLAKMTSCSALWQSPVAWHQVDSQAANGSMEARAQV